MHRRPRWPPTPARNSSFPGVMSTAMICDAPAIRAPCTALSPTPPTPVTTTVAPTGTRAVLNTAPNPVATPQPTMDASWRSMSASIFTTACSCTSIISEKALSWPYWITGVPSASRRRCSSAGERSWLRLVQMIGRPITQNAALVTAPTGASEDVIPHRDAGDLRTDGLDDAGDLVAEDRRERMWPQPVEEEEVAVADACGRRPNEHLPTSRGSDGDRLDLQWRTHFVHDGGADHLSSSVHLPGVVRLQRCSTPGRSTTSDLSAAPMPGRSGGTIRPLTSVIRSSTKSGYTIRR